MKSSSRGRLFPLVTAAAVSLLSAALYLLGAFGALEQRAEDALFQRTAPPSAHIHVIGVDEATIQEYGVFTSWSREKTAALIALLNADPQTRPAAIAVDIMFFTEDDPETDKALAEACAAGNVIMATQASFARTVERSDETPSGYFINDFAVQNVYQPYPALKAATRQGHVNTLPDADGVVRSSIYSIAHDGAVSYSLAAEAVRLYAGSVTPPTLDAYGRFPIRYVAKGGAYYGGSSFLRVLEGAIPAARFAGDIVFIGAYTTGMTDSYITPIQPDTPMYGVEIHANIADALLSGRQFRYVPAWAQLLLTLLTVFFVVYACMQTRLITGLGVFFASLALLAMGLYFAARSGLVCSLLYLPAGLLVGYLLSIVSNYLAERKRRAAVTNTFKQYVAPNVVDSLLKAAHRSAAMQERRDIAVMFLDVRSFTSLSESLPPEDIVSILNEYLSLITEISFRNGGTIDKFIGDGAMVLFNAPLDQPNYEYAAVKTAWEIQHECLPLAGKLKARCGRDVMLGIGVNCGPAVVGSIGTPFRMDYTAIGDTVNTAARLEGKAGPGEVVLSPEMHKRLLGRIQTESIGELALKGKAEKLACYRLTSLTKE